MQEDHPMRGMWVRYAMFIVLSFAILFGSTYLQSLWRASHPPAPVGEPAAQGAKPAEAKPGEGKPVAEQPAQPAEKPTAQVAEKPAAKAAEKPPVKVEAEPQHPDAFVTLGSADPASPYRMLVTLTSRGAAVSRIELSSPRYRELEDHRGYLGQIVVDKSIRGAGCVVQVVGAGTPAEAAGLQVGDLIKAVGEEPVSGFHTFEDALAKTKPGQTVDVSVVRKVDGKSEELTLPVKLGRRPLDVVQPEGEDPVSFLTTLRQIDDQKLVDAAAEGDKKPALDVNEELDGLNLRSGNWELVSHDPSKATFRRKLSQWGLELVKTYRLAEVADEQHRNADAKAYHLTLEVAVRNVGQDPRTVALQVDGPTGLPTEGWWYSSKVRGGGIRDVLVSYRGETPEELTCDKISRGEWNDHVIKRADMAYLAVDAQYFAAAMIPDRKDYDEPLYAGWRPIAVGPVNPDLRQLANVSFRFEGQSQQLKPGEENSQRYTIFAGPKKPELLAQYGLGNVITYGWYWFVAEPLLKLLHTFYAVTFNYGLAIIMLTIVVRGCMFPFSRKQALNAQKMQELQPEIKKLQEKYKNNLEARGKAQQELFKKHNYNPLGGCLIVFLQLPIFVGLYRALQVDVELRQAPLISQSIHWASNLAAPDMLFNWSGFWHTVGLDYINRGVGMFGLGPYFNLLPLITIALFIWQQKKFMPPPTDEQAAIQMKVMQYMMIFMGILFYKVASGLCLYFIASSLWSIAERKYLPKTAAAKPAPEPARSAAADLAARKKNRNRR